MQAGSPHLLASIDSIRPVFLIVMGVSLLMLAWRLSKNATGWTGRFMLTGAFLLALGYGLILPLYEAGKIERINADGHYHSSEAAVMAWHGVKMVSMNAGWLLFGLGLALHANLFGRRPSLKTFAAPTR